MPPHLRGKPGSGDDRPPPEPRRDDFDRGGRSGNFYCNLKYVAMWRKFVLVSQKRYMRQRVKKKFSISYNFKEQVTQKSKHLRNEK